MNYTTPEKVGISSARIIEFIKKLESKHLSTHSIVMVRGNDIFYECYYKPFDKNFKHRMYSVSKSFVSIAVGFCEQDGLLSLDDRISKYFGEYIKDLPEDKIPDATIREMLHMETATEHSTNWFKAHTDDRTKIYFEPFTKKYPDTVFTYDSSGSYILCTIVEMLTGKPFLKYLQEKVLDDIGFSKDAYCIKVPGGHSFGDSGIMCTSTDLALFARFVMNKGTWNGKRYLNEKYLTDATDTKISTEDFGFEYYDSYGYGYQFWGAKDGCFSMNGMGNQYALCDPKNDFIFVINSDNQGNSRALTHITDAVFDIIRPAFEDKELIPDENAVEELQKMTESRELFFLGGNTESDFSDEINGKRFVCEENPMGIKWFSLEFKDGEGTFNYENGQGIKALGFGFGHNVFEKFPEENMSDLIATVPEKGHKYDCAVSADWAETRKLRVRVQVIDKYFGNLAIVFGFRDASHVTVRMSKIAEAFLAEYSGIMNAKAE